MKNIQIDDNDLFCRHFGGYDLHLMLKSKGIDSTQLVWEKISENRSTHSILEDLPPVQSLYLPCKGLEMAIPLQASHYPMSTSILFNKHLLDADVIHLHLIHNEFFNLSLLLPLLSAMKPVVWTLHDPWAITGHCVHPYECERWIDGCGDCPRPEAFIKLSCDASALNWEMKRIAYSSCDLDIIVASRWMESMVKRSPLLKGARLHRIPFGLDLKKFKPMDDRQAKVSLGIPADDIVLCFRSTHSEFKGFDRILECLENLERKSNITLLTFNDTGLLEKFKDRFNIVEIGWTLDDKQMIDAYNASDIFLMPSRAESFGMMAMEAMACGKPVVAMSGTALNEVIKAEENAGVIVPQDDTKSFIREVNDLIANKERRVQIGASARKIAERDYDANRYLDSIISVYEKAIERRAGDRRAQYLVSQLKLHKPPEKPSPKSIVEMKSSRLARLAKSIPPMRFAYRIAVKPLLAYLKNRL